MITANVPRRIRPFRDKARTDFEPSLGEIRTALETDVVAGVVIEIDFTFLVTLGGAGQWVYSASSPTLTYYAVRPKHDLDATEAMGILLDFRCVAIHDG